MKKHQYLAILGAALLVTSCAGNDPIEPVELDLCPNSDKTAPGDCGCDTPDDDNNGNGISDCLEVDMDLCPDSEKTHPGKCGCEVADDDSDGDTVPDCLDQCPNNADKQTPGFCGCDEKDEDADNNGAVDCLEKNSDQCADVPNRLPGKKTPGVCGCDKDDELDSDNDTVPDCIDLCHEDNKKIVPGVCGCGESEDDNDGDMIPNCKDGCPDDSNKIEPGICGCGIKDDVDSDGDTVPDCNDGCPNNPKISASGVLSCDENDIDGDGFVDDIDVCKRNPTIHEGNYTDDSKCNIIKEDDVDVFQIWTSLDFDKLNEYLTNLYNSDSDLKTNILCKPGSYTCGSNKAFYCPPFEDEFSTKIAIEYTACNEKDKVLVAKNADCNEVEGEVCSNSTDLLHCKKIDDNVVYVDQKQQCTYNGRGKCVDAVGCEPESQPADKSDAYGYECTSEYVSACDNGEKSAYKGSYKTCLGNTIVPVFCLEACKVPTDFSHVRCIQAQSVEKPKFKIRLMHDIYMADYDPYDNKSASSCYSQKWDSIDLNKVEFDGNHHTIKYSSSNTNCSMVKPLFGSVYNSTIKDLTLEYDFRGQGSSVLANLVSRSIIDNVSYKGIVEYEAGRGEKTDGIDDPAFGVMAAYANKSKLNNIHVAGKIYYSGGSASAVIGKGNDFILSNAEVKLDLLYCKGTICSGAVGKGFSRSVFDTVTVDINDFQSESAFTVGLSYTDADMYNINLKIDNLNVNKPWASLFMENNIDSGDKEIMNVDVDLKNVTSQEDFYAAWATGTKVKASNVAVKIENISFNKNVFAIHNLMDSSLTDFAYHCVIQGNSKGSDAGFIHTLTNSSLKRVVNSSTVIGSNKYSLTGIAYSVTNKIFEGENVYYRADTNNVSAFSDNALVESTADKVKPFKKDETNSVVETLNAGDGNPNLWIASELQESNAKISLPWLKD